MNDSSDQPAATVSAAEIREYIVASLVRELEVSADQLRTDQPLTSFGIDSIQLIGLIADLEVWLRCRILNNPLPRFPTIDQLAAWIAAELAAGHHELDPNRPLAP